MTKLNIKAIIELTDEKLVEETSATIEKGIITYQENNGTYVYLDINRHELVRENNDMLMKYVFIENEETKGKIFVKELNQEIELEIKTTKIEKEDDKYKVEYIVGNDTFTYEVKYSEV